MRAKVNSSKDRDMEEDNGFGFEIGGVTEVVDVSVGPEAADDGAARWGINALALGADGDLAVVTDAHAGLLAPDKRPPGTGGGGTEDGTIFG